MQELQDENILPLPARWRRMLDRTTPSSPSDYLSIPNIRSDLFHLAPSLYSSLFLYSHALVGHRLSRGHRSLLLNPDYLSVRLVVSGCEYIRYDHHLYLAEEGDVMILLPHHSFEYAACGDHPCTIRSVAIKGTLLESIIDHSRLKDQCFLHPQSTDFFLDSFRELCDLTTNGNEDAPARNAGIVFRLLQALQDMTSQAGLPPRLRNIMRFIDEQVESPLDVEQLSRRANCSSTTLNSLFRWHLRCSPHRYVTACRMRHAHEMLQRQIFSVKETAARLGFSSQFNFSTQFRRYFGYPPRQCLEKTRRPDRS